ncbi:MAG: hypothetical protein OXQ31_01755 [Spirochaetaceae bacterium]|nr:hypothetical protein [Spirochaetaceae bacterium]
MVERHQEVAHDDDIEAAGGQRQDQGPARVDQAQGADQQEVRDQASGEEHRDQDVNGHEGAAGKVALGQGVGGAQGEGHDQNRADRGAVDGVEIRASHVVAGEDEPVGAGVPFVDPYREAERADRRVAGERQQDGVPERIGDAQREQHQQQVDADLEGGAERRPRAQRPHRSTTTRTRCAGG